MKDSDSFSDNRSAEMLSSDAPAAPTPSSDEYLMNPTLGSELLILLFSSPLAHNKFTNSKHLASTHFRRERTADHIERSGSSTTDNEMPITSTVTTHHQKKTMITSPKQRYYLGENPYGGSIFGKENKYQNGASRDSEIVKQKNYYNSAQIHPPARRQRSEEPTAG